ncbi:MAG: hypothetical protein H7343_22175 [Undibacterium sp.]|nr:hypothetical protein [Opitutaceae bacterium]
MTGPALATGGNIGFEGSLIVTLRTALLADLFIALVRRSARTCSKNSR